MNIEEKTQIEKENLLKINTGDLFRLSQGRLIYIEHPTKGIVKTKFDGVYVETVELTEKEREEVTEVPKYDWSNLIEDFPKL